ncbi:MAG TPA: DUF6268 family outer membrane beta-barrel protein [Candidatus Babeliales bacterium]|jgi:hypothetical protein|nr:DUF6268 family outer membrane beta-barrel protein [Candidatus Babeliales bacterium]
MKMFGLQWRIFVLAVLILLVRTGYSEESNGFWPLSGEYSADLTYIGDGSVERGDKHVNDFDEIDSDIRVVLTPRMKLGVLRFGAEWERFSFGFSNNAPLPNTLQSFSTIIGFDTQLSDSILIRAETQPGLYNSGLGHLFWDDFNMPFVIGGTYIFSPNVQLVLGVSVDIERKYPVIPAAGIRWKLGPQWVLDAVMPTPRLQYELNRNVSLYAGATITEATFRTDDAFGDTHGMPKLNHAVVTYSDIRTGAGFDWKISPIVTFTAEAGYQPYRQFDFYRADIRYHQDGGAPYGSFSLHGTF